MKTIKKISAMLIYSFLAAGFISTGIFAQKYVTKKEFEVKPGGTIKIALNNGGSIDIKGWDKDLMLAQTEGEDAGFRVDKNGNDIMITNNPSKNSDGEFSLKVWVPKKFNLAINSLGGDIEISGIEGKMNGNTAGGDLNLYDLKGALDLSTLGGDITLRNSKVDGRVKTNGGDVLVEDVTGSVDASSMGGSVRHVNVKSTGSGNNNAGAEKEINISSMGGDIEIDTAPNGAKLKTMGGDITLNHAGKFLEAHTQGGDISAKSVDGKVYAKTMGGDIEIKITGGTDGKKDAELISMGGDITLTVPKGLSMNIEIEIAYTQSNKKHKFEDYKIHNDLQLKEERSSDWDTSKGTPRKYITAKGNVAGGKNTIKIKTINGNVYLKQS